ncbi:MAG: 3-isopropylmalate dehydratase [Bacillota bacterium]|jgi:3-isopropylmalate/(R)-2-methylmalate dehydratase small subunit
MKFSGKVWMFGDEINTDLIFPHSALRASPDEQCRLCMSDNRPGWSSLVEKGDVLIAGKNFGTGSSRPSAAILRRLGLIGMAAESFNGLFFRNCICYGFPALCVPGVTEMFREGDLAEINVVEGNIRNLRTGELRCGSRLAEVMTDILRAGGIEGVLQEQGYITKQQEEGNRNYDSKSR